MDEHVTTGQGIMLISVTRLALAVSTMPATDLPPYNQDLWFMILISIIYTIIMFLPLLFLANRFKQFNLAGYLRIIYGEKIGAIFVVLYGLYFLSSSVNGLTVLVEVTTSTILLHESSMNFVFFAILIIFFIISKGIVSISRGFQLLAPIALAIIILLIALGIPNVDFTFMKPILKDSSFLDINEGAILLSQYFSDIFLLLMIVPDLKEKKISIRLP